METSLTLDEGHAHVAAVRVLRYRLQRPPTIEEVAEALGSKVELTNHRLRALEERGIVSIVENPFEAHVSVKDHLALEKLPVEREGEDLADAVEDFRRRQEEKGQEMMRIFEEKDEAQEKKSRHDEMADELRSFRKKKAKKAPWEKDGD